MIVTINTDASFSWSEERGSFAFWIVSNSGKVAMSGMLRKRLHRAEQAEFQCIINSLHVLINQNWKNIEKIIINTDCLNVIHLLKNDKKAIEKYRLRSWGNHLVLEFTRMRARHLGRVPMEIRHVKAHQEISSAKQWVNDWCDTEAKKALMKFINSKVKKV